MEFVIIVCSATLQEDVEDMFKKHGVKGYTHLPVVHGSGQGGGTRLDTDTWPGHNLTYFIAVTSDQYLAISSWARGYRESSPREGLKIFSLAMKEMI